jgi:surface protein
METMLQNCTELEYLDLSNFNTSKDNDMGWMFNQCHKLKYLNLSNFSLNNDCLTTNIFHNINKNECKIFISGLNLNNLFQKK